MVDLMDLVGPASSTATISNGAGYLYIRRYEWVSYPEAQPTMAVADPESEDGKGTVTVPATWWREEFIGFRARVMVNPSGAQLRHEQALFKQFTRLNLKEADYLSELADRVSEWDLVLVDDESGERVPVKSPKDGGWEMFLELPPLLLTWLMLEVRTAHIPKVMTSVGNPAGQLASKTDPALAPPDQPPPTC